MLLWGPAWILAQPAEGATPEAAPPEGGAQDGESAPSGEDDDPALRAEVLRGWYLWRTGQVPAAAELASRLASEHPLWLAARELDAAMAVASGDGASGEVRAREWWGDAIDDPTRRVTLAFAITFRHAERGAWCDEVGSLVSAVGPGEAYRWAVLADRERERRCTGETGHADAALVDLWRKAEPGWMDGVLAKMEAGYLKEDMPEALDRVWTREPHRVDRAAALWRDGAAGATLGGSRRVARKALRRAAASDDPILVHAALVAYATLERKKAVDALRVRLAALDPGADPALIRTRADLSDPPIYADIDACARDLLEPADSLRCLDALPIPESGSVAALASYVRRLLEDARGDADAAYAAARAAHLAEPGLRFHARAFSRLVLERLPGGQLAEGDLPLALSAADTVLAGRDDPEALSERVRASLADDLETRGRLRLAAGQAEGALADLRAAGSLGPSPVRSLLVGLALAGAGQEAEAGLELAYGLAADPHDTALITRARDTLRPIAASWLPGGLRDMVEAAARAPGDKAPPHPLVGQTLDASLLPTLPEGVEPGVRLVVVWASRSPESIEALSRVAAAVARYADRGVTAVALGVDPTEVALPEDLDAGSLQLRHAGPEAMRALRSVSLPTVVVVDGKGKVVAGLSPYDRKSLALENALDGMLPKK